MNIRHLFKKNKKYKPISDVNERFLAEQKMVKMPCEADKSSEIKAELICKSILGTAESEFEQRVCDQAFEDFHSMVKKIGETFPKEINGRN